MLTANAEGKTRYDFNVTTDKRVKDRVIVYARSYELAHLQLIEKIIEEQHEIIELIEDIERSNETQVH